MTLATYVTLLVESYTISLVQVQSEKKKIKRADSSFSAVSLSHLLWRLTGLTKNVSAVGGSLSPNILTLVCPECVIVDVLKHYAVGQLKFWLKFFNFSLSILARQVLRVLCKTKSFE